jgi:hypothetical protein
MHRIVRHLRANVIAYVALGFALAAGGGYALAATNTKKITVCADKTTGVLHLRVHGRCGRRQTRVTWNQQGPQGAQGQPGAAAVSAWANVTNSGSVLAGQGVSVQRVSAGDYQVTITATGCAKGFNAPVVSVSDSYPPAGHSAGAFPIAWVGDTGTNEHFTVDTGVVVSGSFTPTDHSFNLQDACS